MARETKASDAAADESPAARPAPIAVKAPPPTPPTAPRRMDAEGFELDEWGLPRVGPIRVARLAEMKRTDPDIDPTGWTRVDAPGTTQE